YRVLKCATPDGEIKAGKEPARCHMIIKDAEDEQPGRPAPEGDGCFTEVHNGEERHYCDLVCPKAHTVFNAHINQGHRACFNFYTYQLEKRDQEWFIWRSGKCLNSTAEFTIGCKFDEPFNTQFKTDNDVFARLRARARKA
ncbi:Protein T05H10.3, partial [Aphelenchoides avenae]